MLRVLTVVCCGLLQWIPELRHYCPTAHILLVGTQIDRRDDQATLQSLAKRRQRPIPHETGERLARQLNAACYVECSALTQVWDGFNIMRFDCHNGYRYWTLLFLVFM